VAASVTYRISSLVARAQRLAVALLAVTVVLSAPTAAVAASRPRDTAGDAQDRVEAAQRAANAEGERYMSALSEFESVKTQASGVENAITAGEQRAGLLKRIVQKRAARAYMRAGSSLPTVLTITDVGDLMRSDKLLATANVEDTDALSLLSSQQQDLREQREHLRQLEAQQGAALADLQRASRKADALLASALSARADVQSRLAAQAASRRASRSSRRTTGNSTPIVAVAPAPSSGTSGPSHNGDSFLACVRQRESRGNYSVVNPSGPWYGAYQFLASTWNVTARHAGRIDLVGVIPSNASPADQDAMAWHLYQWQGSGPWGGSC
jgi:peptidoglycan hydrolase CwlO-like protein